MKGKMLIQFKKISYYVLAPLLMLVFVSSVLFNLYRDRFDESIFNPDNVYNHIKELSSPGYEGRLAGTNGNILALKYVEDYFKKIGVEPAGDNGTYYQNLTSMIPVNNSDPYFNIVDSEGKSVKSYKAGEDYAQVLQDYGGSGEVNGRLFYLSKYIRNYNPAELKNNIIIIENTIQDKDIEYAIDSGVKAIIEIADQIDDDQPVDIGKKMGRTILIDSFKRDKLNELVAYAQKGYRVQLKSDVSFKVLNTPNLLGRIEGRKKNGGYLIISAHIDQMGERLDGSYYPGSLDNASGVGFMMEMARLIKLQKNPPDKTIIFAAWNNEENGMTGSKYYVNNPIYPLSQTQVMVLDGIGGYASGILNFDTRGTEGAMIRNLLNQYTRYLGYNSIETSSGRGSDHQSFIDKDIPAVLIRDQMDGFYTANVDKNNMESINRNNIVRDGKVLTTYIDREVYRNVIHDLLSKNEAASLVVIILGMILIYLAYALYRLNSGIRILGIKAEDIYYSTAYNLISRFYYFGILIFVVFLSLVFIAFIPPNFNVSFINGQAHTNFSLYITLKNSLNYVGSLFTKGFGDTLNHFSVAPIIYHAFWKSMNLILLTMLIAFTVGIWFGVIDGYRKRDRGSMSTMLNLVGLSLPDVFVVIVAQIFIGWAVSSRILGPFIDIDIIKFFIIPLLCLSIIPTMYVTRIVSTSIREEIKKEYIKAARAKGLSRREVLLKHILIGAIIKVLDSMPTVLTIIISNMIVVEYLFYYPGIVYNLFSYYKEGDIATFIGLALSLGVIYISFILLIKLVAYLINPVKREGMH